MSKSSLIILILIVGAAATLLTGWFVYSAYGFKILIGIITILTVIGLYGFGPEIGKYSTKK